MCDIFISMYVDFMTFRPSDDVLEELSANAQLSNTLENTGYNEWASSQWGRLFFNANDENKSWDNLQNVNSDEISQLISNEPVEEIKSPDLSELLKNSETDNSNEAVENVVEQNEQVEQDFSIDLSEIQSENPQDLATSENNQENNLQNTEVPVNQAEIQNPQGQQNPVETSNDDVVSIDGKMWDEERVNLVSEIEWSVHSSLDLLVDEQRANVVRKYKKIYRIVFKRWIFIFAAVLWICAWIFVQVKASHSGKINIINESSIYDIDDYESVSSNLLGWSITGITISVPYGFSRMNWNEFLTKSNLVLYKWIILPQLASIDINSDKLISLEDFENLNISRSDLEVLVDTLVKNNSLNRVMKSLPNVSDYKWQWQTLEWWLIEGFSLWCMFTKKVSATVCDKFLGIFYKYGKYYNLSSYDADLLKLIKEIKKQKKSVEPICDMVKEYVLRSNMAPSETLWLVMNYCSEEDQVYYKKLVGFIDVDNSLWQPELSNVVFDDPDLNAYKLLSARQNVNKILEWAAINEGYIISYLNFVQNLIDKDRWTHNYLGAIYTDLLYVFNMDELYDKLLKKSMLSSEIKSKIDLINNWNFLLKNESLLSHLTTPNITVSNGQFTGSDVQNKTIEDMFAQYYSMTDRLKIKPPRKISDDQLMVNMEMFSDKIYSATAGETLKATVYLYRKNNYLYVKEINIARQPKLSYALNVYASSSLVTLYAMIWYIDEQVWYWYEEPVDESGKQKSLCEQLRENTSIVVYDCDDSNILLYGWDWTIEYSFALEDWILQSFSVSDEDLDSFINNRLWDILFSKDNTPTIITSIIGFKLEKAEEEDDNLETKIEIANHFGRTFKIDPIVSDIEWEDDVFLVEFVLGDEFTLRARYNVDTQLLTKISYFECGKTLEIRNLTIKVSADNESQLKEILNNPRIFLTRANPAAFQKYQKMCEED